MDHSSKALVGFHQWGALEVRGRGKEVGGIYPPAPGRMAQLKVTTRPQLSYSLAHPLPGDSSATASPSS